MTRCAGILILFLSHIAVIPSHASEVLVYDITRLSSSTSRTIPLMSGQRVTFQQPVPRGGRVLFKDWMPRANWTHRATYEMLSPDSRVLESLEARFPPAGLGKSTPLISGKAISSRLVTNADFKLDTFQGTMKVKDPKHFYAVLINGAGNDRHWNDLSFLYRVLTQIYGYDPANIFAADSNYIKEHADFDGDGRPDILYETTLSGVRDLMHQLAKTITPEDQLVVAVDDHGGLNLSGDVVIALADDLMTAGEFGKLITNIPAKRVLSIFEPCFSGGLVRPVVSEQRVAMAAAANNESSWQTADDMWDAFIFPVISGFARQLPDGTPIAIGSGDPIQVNAKQAFIYALGMDTAAESPFLEAAPNSGFATTIGLGF